MRSFFAVGLSILSCTVIQAQVHAPGVAAPSPPALGGSFASRGISRPLGGVALPTFPGSTYQKTFNRASGARYIGPVYYVPNAFDSYYDPSSWGAAPPGQISAPPQPPVIINQYFGTRSSERTTAQNDENGATTFQPPAEDPVNPGDPIGAPQNYYLIAYKNHEIYTALAYWVEDKTLHYVTTQNTHNQASLDLIDIDRTTKLNADRSVPFSIAAR